MGLPRPDDLSPDLPVLIAGPTASGKSALALAIAEAQGRTVVNADALQVFGCWRVLTARPGPEALSRAGHALYGHVAHDADYSVGHWLREVAPLLAERPAPVVVGGTGLYFTALTEGLADIPPSDPALRAVSNRRLAAGGLDAMLAELDAPTRRRIDTANPVRVQRAWEVLQQTGRGLAAWQAETPPPLLPLQRAYRICLVAAREWLAARIDARFDAMLRAGAWAEVRAMAGAWDPSLPAAKAIGARELMAALEGRMSESEAVAAAKAASRRYAKRQRTWLRQRMHGWQAIEAGDVKATLSGVREGSG